MLKDKIALITGGGKGIGAGIAKEMAAQGAVVIINYSHSEAAAKQVQSEIRTAGGKADIFCCDVSDYNSVKAMTGDIIQHYGRLDILVNNAGIVKDGLLMRMKEMDFDKVIDINLKGIIQLYPERVPTDAETKIRAYYQYVFGCRYLRQCGPGKLRRVQSRNHWIDKVCSKGTWKPRDYGQCHCTRIYSDRYD